MADIRTLEISILYYANVIHGTKRDVFNHNEFYISNLSNIPAHLYNQTVMKAIWTLRQSSTLHTRYKARDITLQEFDHKLEATLLEAQLIHSVALNMPLRIHPQKARVRAVNPTWKNCGVKDIQTQNSE